MPKKKKTSASSSKRPARARPGRRTTEERRTAVMELFAGKAKVAQLAQRGRRLPETVEGWRQSALEAVGEAMRFGPGSAEKSDREKELEQELKDTRHALTESAIQAELLRRLSPAGSSLGERAGGWRADRTDSAHS